MFLRITLQDIHCLSKKITTESSSENTFTSYSSAPTAPMTCSEPLIYHTLHIRKIVEAFRKKNAATQKIRFSIIASREKVLDVVVTEFESNFRAEFN